MKEDFTHNITHELKTPIAVAYAANDALLNFNGAENLTKTTELSSDYPNPAETAQRTGGTDPFHEYGATEELPSEL